MAARRLLIIGLIAWLCIGSFSKPNSSVIGSSTSSIESPEIVASFQTDEYISSSISFSSDKVTINTNRNTYAHIEGSLLANVTNVNTTVTLVSGDTGVDWAPGIGMMWGTGNVDGVWFGLANESNTKKLIFTYNLFPETLVTGRYEFTGAFSDSVDLSLHVNRTSGTIEPFYRSETGVWSNFLDAASLISYNGLQIPFVAHIFDKINTATYPTIYSLENHTILFGKGYADYWAGTNLAGDDFYDTFNTIQGDSGISELTNMSISYGIMSPDTITSTATITETVTDTSTTTTTELSTDTSTATSTEHSTDTVVVNRTVSEPASNYTQTVTETANELVAPFYVIPLAILIVVVPRRKPRTRHLTR